MRTRPLVAGLPTCLFSAEGYLAWQGIFYRGQSGFASVKIHDLPKMLSSRVITKMKKNSRVGIATYPTVCLQWIPIVSAEKSVVCRNME